MGTNITGIGNANAIGFKSRVTGGAYFPPELKDALVGVWSAYGKSNDSTDRNIIKNKIKDKGGDFELLNFNYKEGSGYGKYTEDYTSWIPFNGDVVVSDSKLQITNVNQISPIGVIVTKQSAINSCKVKITGIPAGANSHLYYRYDRRYGGSVSSEYYRIYSDGIYDLPASIYSGLDLGFTISGLNDNEKWVGLTIEQIPEFKGAVVMDNVDDMIISQKSVQEMLRGSNEITVISMIHQIGGNKVYTYGYTNYIRHGGGYIRNSVSGTDGNGFNKTGIYGYTATKLNTSSMNLGNVVNDILGDKGDYSFERSSTYILDDAKYSVSNFINANDRPSNEGSELAWYWTFIANRVLTEDEINLVIEKYNLDRPGEIVKPQVYYNVKKQKITNENHSAFDDKLIDYSGNGYDAKLYNFNWDKQSGIGNYPISFKDYTYVPSRATVQVNKNSFTITSNSNTGNFLEVNTKNKTLPIYKVKVEGTNTITNGELSYRFNNTEGVISRMSIPEDGEYEIPESPSTVNSAYSGWCINGGTNDNIEVKVTVIPEYKDSLVFDGVDDYGKVTGLPVLKDYTIAVYRKWLQNYQNSGSLVSKSNVAGSGSFLMEQKNYNNISATYSYGTRTENLENPNLDKDIYTYQSKYIYNGVPITAGTGVDGTDMWLATIRDRDERFSSFALKTLMLFPYSLSEFLLERQIEKIKSGTLYPDMVEFRPIISEDENITGVKYFSIDSAHNWTPISPGDYLPVGQHIAITVNTVLPYKVSAASSSQLTISGISQSAGGYNAWDIHAYMKKGKTPQKIRLTTAVNEDIVQWNPTISANIPDSYDTVTEWFINGWETKVAVGDWIKKSDRIFFKLKLKDPLHEIGKVTFGGSECQASKASNWSESNNLWEIVTYSSVRDLSQVFNVQIDEYIRYEDIVQPYPVLLRFNDENGNEVSWGGKFRVGSTITRIGSIADPESNLLNGLYSISGLSLNGKAVTSSTSIVEKQMVFKTTATYLLDNNEPKCILSPRLLRIPNSSYKILGHIPDISGHGNHGVIHNSAYTKESGVNGYVENFNDWIISKSPVTVEKTDSQAHISHIGTSYKTLPIFEYTNPKVIQDYILTIEITGIPDDCIGKFIHINTYTQELTNGINTIKFVNNAGWFGFTFYREDGSIIGDCNITIKQIGEYEGAYCLDGVNDFVTIPTLSSGGKQVLMKVNWESDYGKVLYDQRLYTSGLFAIIAISEAPAYETGNGGGKTYIDGILNKNILSKELASITHNITLNNNYTVTNSNIFIGTDYAKMSYAKMALYDFMLFDNISTEDKIKELNEYVGIEENVFEFNPPMFTIDLPMAIKNIKVYQGGNEISPGYLYLNKDTEFEVYVSLNEGKYAVDTITVDGVEIAKDRVVGEYNIFKFTLNGSSEQKITIHSYEYIMYEDIPQPYPALLTFHDGNFNNYTYGDKVKLNSIIKVRAGFNLFPDLYTINSYYLNGEKLSFNALAAKDIVVTNDITLTAEKVYKLEGSAPKCIFSPSKLRIPNSSYKYLGYIPDISGNGNNGIFYNFAYEGMSGANGYSIIFGDNKTYQYLRHSTDFNPTTINFAVKSINAYTTVSLLYSYIKQSGGLTSYNKYIPSYKIKVSGIKEGFTLKYTYIKNQTDTSVSVFDIVSDGVHTIPPSYQSEGNLTNNDVWIGFTLMGTFSDLYNITVEVLPDYEGSICFDGVDDYIKIDTTGGMTMLMKANVMSTFDRILYDQRDKNSEGNMYKEFAVLTSSSDSILAYAGRNPNGKTYIDGVLNTNITCGQLLNITHNITALPNSNLVGTEQGVRIGASVMPASYCKAAVFDFMLFDTKCTDDVIKQLNDIIGIEGNYVQRPPYYWDAYGKTNLDEDKNYTANLGTVKDVIEVSQPAIFAENWYDGNPEPVLFSPIINQTDYSIEVKANKMDNNFTMMLDVECDTPLPAFKAKFSMVGTAISVDLKYYINGGSKIIDVFKSGGSTEPVILDIPASERSFIYGTNTDNYPNILIEVLPADNGTRYGLTNTNFAYDKMSGYGGYTLGKFTNSWSLSNNSNSISIVARNPYDITLKKLGGNSDWEFNTTELKIISNPVSVKFKSDKNIRFTCDYHYYPVGENSEGTPLGITSKDLIANEDAIITISPISQENIDKYNIDINRGYYLVYFQLSSTLAINEEVTIEMLPIYPNGLVFDGVDDYSRNINVPAFTDFTYVFKRELLNNPNASASMYSGSFQALGGGAFIADFSAKGGGATDGLYGFSFGNSTKVPSLGSDEIIYGTKTSVNGTNITPGSNIGAGKGITLGKWDTYYKQMVFYKLMLYPRTTNMLTINMIKNMMAEDGIIDIQGKLFTDKFTGDFNLDFNKDFLIGN